MKWIHYVLPVPVLGLLFCLVTSAAFASADNEKIATSLEVLKDITRIPEKSIPASLLNDAHGIVIIPDAIKLGFVVGGKYGSGILMVHRADGSWSNPSFIKIYGGSFGWQVGAQATDLILIFKSRRSIDGIRNGKFTFGADAEVAAGPVGRSASAATDVLLKAEIISYSRSRGIFAGLSLGGASLQIDDDSNADFYNKPGIRADDIFNGERKSPNGTVWKIKELLTNYPKAETGAPKPETGGYGPETH